MSIRLRRNPPEWCKPFAFRPKQPGAMTSGKNLDCITNDSILRSTRIFPRWSDSKPACNPLMLSREDFPRWNRVSGILPAGIHRRPAINKTRSDTRSIFVGDGPRADPRNAIPAPLLSSFPRKRESSKRNLPRPTDIVGDGPRACPQSSATAPLHLFLLIKDIQTLRNKPQRHHSQHESKGKLSE